MSENRAETVTPIPNLASLGKAGAQTENPKSTSNLKLRHEKFVECYLANGGNGTQAARDAGYSPNPGSLRTLGSWLLKKPQIQERIRIRILEGARVHTDEVLGVLASRMRANLMDVLDDTSTFTRSTRSGSPEAMYRLMSCSRNLPRSNPQPADLVSIDLKIRS